MKKIAVILLISLFYGGLISAKPELKKVEPSFWWVGMKNPNLQLMVYGTNISNTKVKINYPGVELKHVSTVQNPNYLFIDLKISPETKSGKFDISFQQKGETVQEHTFELKERKTNSSNRAGFNTSDVIYLITPDRFVNGDPDNDSVTGMKEKPNRNDKDGRHGGDIRGIINSLDYLQDLGFTAVWLNPVLENNMTQVSYHGYSTTDFYNVDPRYGTNEEYLELNNELDKRGMKLIMDMIFNHCGSEHWWMEDMPMPDWINNFPEYKITNHRHMLNQDPYASDVDKKTLTDGWFVPTMPDLNQRNPFMETYLIQNSIWWIEYVGLEGIRQDTWPYPDKEMMAKWTECILNEYPDFNIVGEEWTTNPAIISYFQKGKINSDGYSCSLPSLMDFPLQNAVVEGLKNTEEWGKGLIQINEALANDFQYPNPENLVVFPDNHDMSRFFMQVEKNVDLHKLGIAFFLTTRGIPQIYYGTEILMTHPGNQHGDIRADFPGGWENDKINAFSGEGLTPQQKNMQEYFRTIQNWRKKSDVIHNGKLKHYIPQNGMYVYFRYNTEKSVMIILNKNKTDQKLNTSRFAEVIKEYKSGMEIISSEEIKNIKEFDVPARSAMIIELK